MNITTLRRSLLLVSLGSAVLVPSLRSATDTPPPPPPPPHHGAGQHEKGFDPEKRLARLTEKLNLTADQQAKIRPILAAQAEAMKTIDATPLTGDQRREKMMQLHKENREKIGAILTPEQRKEMADAFREKRHERREHRDEHPDAPPPPPAPEPKH